MMLGVERTFPGQDKAFADQLNLEYKEQDPATVSFTDPVTGTVWRFDETLRSIVTQEGSDAPVEYGYGELTRKAVHRKATKNREECVEVQIILSPVTQKDHEIVEYSPNPDENAKLIQAHMDRWVTKPYELGENRVGVEINFNKLFYVPETLRPLNEIQDELKESFKRLNTLMNDIFN
jgi:type I restriction enzyme M protein